MAVHTVEKMRQYLARLWAHSSVRYNIDLLLVFLAALLTVPLAVMTDGALRVSFAIPFIIFIPGYCLVAALYPRRDGLDGKERLALSFGTSIAVVPLIGLALNYTPWGIRLMPILVSITAFIVAGCAVAWYRRGQLHDEERFSVAFSLPQLDWANTGRADRLLTIALVASIVFAAGTLLYVVTNPKKGEQFTEFYILGTSGMAEGYPSSLVLEQPASLIMGVVNHEGEPVEYTVQARLDGDLAAVLLDVEEGTAVPHSTSAFVLGPLEDEDKWQHGITVAALTTGQQLKLEFLLFNPRPRDGYHLRALLGDDGYVTLALKESEGQAEVVLHAGETLSHDCRLDVWQDGGIVAQEDVSLGVGTERKLTLQFPPGEALFRVYDGDALALDDTGAELALHLWVDVRSVGAA